MKLYLAPMEGVIDHHMRNVLTSIGGLDICVTEFIRITDHVLPEKVFRRYCPELTQAAHGTPVRIQLLGSQAQALAKNAAKAAKMGAAGIDLNFGCPAKTVNKNRGGACLLNETTLIQDIVRQVRDAVPEKTPVSVKIRLGYELRDNYLKNALAIEEAGADELIVHARSKADAYKPPAYWECIYEIREAIKIPVIANGEIWTVQDFSRCKETSQCTRFMLGRGILAQPDLALAIRARETNTEYSPLRWPNIAELALNFFESTFRYYPKKYTGNRLKQWLYYLQKCYPEAVALFEEIKRERDENSIRSAIKHSMH